MASEKTIRDALCLSSTKGIHELGVFPPPGSGLDTWERWTGVPEGGGGRHRGPGRALPAGRGQDRHVHQAPEVDAVLGQGHARRLAADPRVLILEDIPEPELIKGPVISLRRRRWVIDTRSDEPAVLVTHTPDGSRMVVWGARGEVRLFSIDDEPVHASCAVHEPP